MSEALVGRIGITKFVATQSEAHVSFWMVTKILPAPMKCSNETHFMDDHGNLVPVDFLKLAVVLTGGVL